MSGLASSAPGAEGPDWSPLTNANPSPIATPPPSPLAGAEPGPIQIVNTSAITSPKISPTRSPVLSEEWLSSRRHCSRTTRWGPSGRG